MHGENKTKSRAAIALALCFCVITLTSVLAVKASLDKITDPGSSVTDNDVPATENEQASAKTPVVDSNDNTGKSSGENNNSTQKTQPVKYTAPLTGTILTKYSMDGLVYSKTLDQYMTHPGVDISAPLSTAVTAVSEGTVSRVYNDDRYGITVCVTHDDGVVSIYSNLAEQGLAETGDEVTQGQKIGSVGDTALFESLDESHLHFEMTKDGNCTDPGNYISSFKASQ